MEVSSDRAAGSKSHTGDESRVGASKENSEGRRVESRDDDEDSEHVEGESGRDAGVLVDNERESVDADVKPEDVEGRSADDEDGGGGLDHGYVLNM